MADRHKLVDSRINVGLVSGLEFGNIDFVRRLVRGIDPKRFNLVLTADVLACRVAESEALSLRLCCKWVKWRCRPWRLVPHCPNMVLLYDGGNYPPLAGLVQFAMRNAPQTRFAIFGSDGPLANGLDFLTGTNVTVHSEKRGYFRGDYHSPTDHQTRIARGTGTEI